MTREELEKRLDSAEKQMLGLQDEIQNLKAKLSEAQDEPEIPDFPVYRHEPLYFVHYRSAIVGDESNICNGIMRGDFNAFHTIEYAQEYADKCKLIAMMLHCKWHLCCDYHPDFNNGWSEKWSVVFDYAEAKFTVKFSRTQEWSAIYFDTEESAKKCADWLNEHWRDGDAD